MSEYGPNDVASLENSLRQRILEWEAKMGENDKSLYSLGLRHALDDIDTFLKGKTVSDG